MPREELVRKVDELVAGGMQKGDAVRKVGVEYTTYYRAKRELAAAKGGSGSIDALVNQLKALKTRDLTLNQYAILRDKLREIVKEFEELTGGKEVEGRSHVK